MGHSRSDNLPVSVTSFVDRVRELAEVGELLRRARLVTLIGVGGVGKTRLAVRVAAEIKPRFADGVWLVELSALEDPDVLVHTVSAALGVEDQSARDQLDVLCSFVAEKEILILLDTCERHVSACAELAERLLREAPDLRLLATSRASLGIPGEHLFTVDPLPTHPASIAENAAATLFMDRARAVTSEELGSGVVRLCRRLEGIPLALELAAVRLRGYTVEQLMERLNDRFGLLVGAAARATLPRHQTMRAAIGWSHELCEPLERLLWARLSVFSGTFDLEAVEQVCADERLAPAEVLPGLVEKSILVREGDRFRMLDTLREYGAEWLGLLDEEETQRRRHRDHYLATVRAFDSQYFGPDQDEWLDRLDRDFDNIRVALDHPLQRSGDPEVSLELAARLKHFGMSRRTKEVRHHLERVLARFPEPGAWRVRALYGCAWIMVAQGEPEAAEPYLNDALAIAEDRTDVAWATTILGATALVAGDLSTAVRLLREAGEQFGTAGGFGPPYARQVLAVALMGLGRFDDALAIHEQVRAEAERHGELWLRGYAGLFSGSAELARGNVERAADLARESVELRRRMRDSLGLALSIDLMAQATAAAGDGERAARLAGVSDALWRSFGVPQVGAPIFSEPRKACEKTARRLIGDAAFKEAYEAGLGLTPADGVAYALSAAEGR